MIPFYNDSKTKRLFKKDYERSHVRKCNICFHKFFAKSKYERFCVLCKHDNELFHYSEWLPHFTDECENDLDTLKIA